MSRQRKKLCPLALEKLAELLKQTGHSLTLDDLDAVARVNELAQAVSGCEDPDEQSLINHPVPCGNVTLRKPSAGKLFWFGEVASDWFRHNPELADLCFAYLLSLPNDEQQLDGLLDRESATAIVSRWAKKLTATEAEFARAIARVYPESDGSEDGDDHEPISQGPLFALLAKEYGRDPAWWLWDAPINMVRAMLDDYTARIDAEHDAQRRASGGGGGWRKGGSAKPSAPPATPRMKNQKRLREYCNALRKRWSENDGR